MQNPDSIKSFLIASSAVMVLTLLPTLTSGGDLTGPVLHEGLTVDVEDVVQAPVTATSGPPARINMLVEAPDGSGRLFFNDMRGWLYVLDNNTLLTYMDLTAEKPLKSTPGLATGFVSFAFHPEFGTNGLFYTVHTEEVGVTPPNLGPAIPGSFVQHSILTEWNVSAPASNSFNGTSRELMRIGSIYGFHNLGEIAFNPNATPNDEDYGLLYIGGGDYATGAGDGTNLAPQPEQLQRLDTPYGTLMRIDPLGGPFTRNGTTYDYGIPASNPFANDGDPDTFGEVYAYGFRNAHRIAWDSDSGTPIVSDIGQGNVEEANILVAGANYGWPAREGTFALDVNTDPETVTDLPADDAMFGFTYPPVQYDHDEGAAIAGGFVYRGPVASDLQGKFVFGDIANGRIFYADMAEMLAADDGDPSTTAQIYELNLVYAGQPMTLLEIIDDNRADLRFGTDRAGNIYITSKQDGWVRQLVPRASNSAPASVDLPVISGTAQVGSTLSTTEGNWNDPDGDSLTFSYQWRAAGVDIAGATSNRYTLTANEAQQTVTVVVTADDGNGGIVSAESAATAVVANADTPNSGGGGGGGSTSIFLVLLLMVCAATHRYRLGRLNRIRSHRCSFE